LYFGDHLPLLTRHTGIYYELGFISESDLDSLSAEERYKMYTTPYLAFSNHVDLPATWGDASPYFLGALLADAAGIRLNYYYTFLLQAFESFQAKNDNIFIADGEISIAPLENDMVLEMFKAFQYDRLFGNRYVDAIMTSFP
jgi:hypothetical protein